MDKFVLTAAVAIGGGLLGHYLKIPAGAMIGSMLAAALYNIITKQAAVPRYLPLVLQIAAGAMIGARMTRENILSLKDMVIPALIIVFGVVIINFTIGLLITKFSSLDLATSLFASAPGGMTEMTLAANAMGADTPKVALLQLLRLISVITLLPVLLRLFLNHFPGK
jgi:membrane AbrB-like protein